MGDSYLKCLLAALILQSTGILHADEEALLAHGVSVKGEIQRATADGLEIETPDGLRTYPWAQLSPATRYRFQPLFSDHYNQVLGGIPASERRIEPVDVRLGRRRVKAAPGGGGAAAVSILDGLHYEEIRAMSAKALPSLDLPTYSGVRSWALQYGPRDVLYMVLAPAGPDTTPKLYVHAPGVAAFEQTAAVEIAQGDPAGHGVAAFKRFQVESMFGKVKATFHLDCAYHQERSETPLSITITGRLESGDTKNAFTLYAEPDDLARGEEMMRARRIIGMPILGFSLDPAGAAPRILGTLKMSRMMFLPKRRMRRRVSIELSDRSGTVIERVDAELDKEGLGDRYLLSVAFARVAARETYRMDASIDLGPFFGTAKFRSAITIPAGR